jgi:hypothetical protein
MPVVASWEDWNSTVNLSLKWVRHFHSYRNKYHKRIFLVGGGELPSPTFKLKSKVIK